MAQLEQAFKKYQVEEAECEMYIACEASQVQRIEENGPLARIVYDILRYVIGIMLSISHYQYHVIVL